MPAALLTHGRLAGAPRIGRHAGARRMQHPVAATSQQEPSTSSSGAQTQHCILAALQQGLQRLAPGVLAAAVLVTPPALAAPASRGYSPLADTADLAAQYLSGEEDAFAALDNEVDLSEEVEQPKELRDFLKLFERGTPKDEAALKAARFRAGFRREPNGRVFIRSGDDEWFAVKNDGRVPGFLLLRDEQGYCYYLPPDQAGALVQLDLSDDLVVAQLFANGMWQELIEPLEAISKDTRQPTQLQMSEAEFRGVLSLLDGAIPGEEQALEPLDDEQQ